MLPLSQRDWRWRWHQLGFSSNTIGLYGCTITCLAMIQKCTPDDINAFLKGGGGFANGSLVNWTKLHSCVPSLSFQGRFYQYDNTAVKQVIADHGFCLVQVDAAPIGNPGGTHWVIFIGNHRLLDPWTGAERSTQVFSPTGYVVVTYTP